MTGAAALQPDSGDMADAAFRRGLSWLSPAGPAARLSIVIFHRVQPQPDPLFPDDVDAAQFDRICGWLSAWYRVLPLDAAVRGLKAGTLPERALAITFDDGYADNHDVALPILRRHGLAATFFIATGYLDGGRMWNDTVIESLRRCATDHLDLGDLGLPGIQHLDLASPELRRQAVDAVLGAAKYLQPAERQAAVDRLADRIGARLPDDLMMRADQVRAMALAGMQIGAHTVSHPILARLDDAQARTEIARSKTRLEDLLGQPVRLFAYPNGRAGRDYSRRDAELVHELGFDAAVSTNGGAARAGDGLLFQLPRFTPWDKTRWRFGLRLARNLATKAASA